MCSLRRFFLLVCALLCTTALVAQEVPNNYFELDGNSVLGPLPAAINPCTAPNIPAGCRDDWNLLNGTQEGGNFGSAAGSLVRAFKSAAASPEIFTAGGSKDPNLIASWRWKTGGSPDKDTITNAYAAAYRGTGGHLLLMFGADRFAVNGDANIGLWFFQQDVHPVGSTGGGFSGEHVNGDIFIVSAFSQGGGVSTITVYTWDTSCAKAVNNPGLGDCADSNLRLKFDSILSSSCSGISEGCAIVNSAPITLGWPYLTKFGTNNTAAPAGAFYEGGLDVSSLLGGVALPCFNSFLIETRSSQATSSVLKDFVSGAFQLCGVGVTKACAGSGLVNTGGTSIHYKFNGTAINDGIATLNHVTVVDSLPAGSSSVVFKQGTAALPPAVPGEATTSVSTVTCPSGAPEGAVCADLGPLTSQNVENWSVEFDSTSLNPQNSATTRAASGSGSVGKCTDAGTVCSTSKGDSCVAVPTNSITVTKSCGVPAGFLNAEDIALPGTQLVTADNKAAVQVNFSGQICNTGQTPLSNVALTDSPGATLTPSTIPTLAAAGQTGECAKYVGSYLPSGVTAGDLGGAAGRYSFMDEIKVTGATAQLGQSPGSDVTCLSKFTSGAQACSAATCNICPAGATCSGN